MRKIHLKVQEDLQTTPIEVTTSASDVAEEQKVFTEADTENESEELTLQKKE